MTSRSRAASSASPSAFSIAPADSAFATATAASTSPTQSRMVRIRALARWEKSFATAICALKSYLVSFVASFMAMSSSYSGSKSIGDDASSAAAFGFLAAGGLVMTVGAMGLRLVPVAALFAGAFSLPLPRDAAATADLTAAAVARAGGASTAQGAGEATTAGRGMRVLNPSFPSRRLISDVAWELRARSKLGRRSRLCDTRSVRWRLLSSLLIRRGAA
mmetsp:Transcript_14192/g.60044  ORF Transcript_14192/g.60044 Transcript_14192/m.60044 type:complete len:219 (+) Transcript_14192:2655-3311(+)